jgi:hypothetical protein
MSKLRVVTFAILLLLVVAVGCSSSDQGGSSIERVDIEAKDDYGVTPLHMAVTNSIEQTDLHPSLKMKHAI